MCLDVGHAHLAGDAPDAVGRLSGYIATAHLHDNNGPRGQSSSPVGGAVDWPAVIIMACWKTGYAGPWILRLLPLPTWFGGRHRRAVGARTRLQAILDDLAQPMAFPE